MISTKTGQELTGLEEIIKPNDQDFTQTGLKLEMVLI